MPTLIDLIQQQAQRLRAAGVSFGHGTGNAFDEAAWLVLWSLGSDLGDLEGQARRTLTAAETERAEALVGERIATRQPAAYLTGEAWLQDLPFHIDRRSIVPRSFIAELLVDPEGAGTLDAWLSDRTQRVLDLCTGNGSLAVIAALAYPEVVVDASDLSDEALALARRNVERHRLEGRVALIASDLYAALSGRYDLILCNPPYVTTENMQRLPPEYRHEPVLALHGGADGMDLVRRIVAGAAAHLGDDGVLVLEVGHEWAHFEQAFQRLEAVWLETSAGEDQVLLLTHDALRRWGGSRGTRGPAEATA